MSEAAAPRPAGLGPEGPAAALLPDGRLHLQHGPIDLVITAEGAGEAGRTACRAAAARFRTVLAELVEELAILRRPVGPAVHGRVAARMVRATRPHTAFITPMAAVAGAVADEVLAAMIAAAPLSRAFVNNGGDIAVHLGAGARARVRIASPGNATFGHAHLAAGGGIGGIATSGRGGRSLLLGIADSVTVLARCAADADAAATLIANAVDLPGHPAVRRAPASSLDPDSDLGERLATLSCGPLAAAEVAAALAAGVRAAQPMVDAGLVHGAALFLQHEACTVGLERMLRIPHPSRPGNVRLETAD